ncbi:PaaI family thioesterase [Phenylobacterium sp.]|uniref:PaaI family thioesterase n=1 Tax=Phenylobacterium sp. TaxID=1871053 RepID=UPI00301D0AF4
MNAVTPETQVADPRRMSGIEQLRYAFDPERPERGPGIGRTLNFTVIEIEEGRVVFGGHPDESVYNPIGTVHGGYAATLLDSAVGCAVHSTLKPGQGYTTLELKVAYHKALTKETGPVRAEGRVIQAGRRAAFAEGRLVDEKGVLYATATSTLLVFER